MLDIIREAEGRFHEIRGLLDSNTIRNTDYFAQLNGLNLEAYVSMNEGMCENAIVCQQCAEHRDFLHSMINILDELESGSPLSHAYEEKLETYSKKVTEVLTKISAILTSL